MPPSLPDVAGLMRPPDFNSESAPGSPVQPGAIVVANNNDGADSHVVVDHSLTNAFSELSGDSATASSEEAAQHVENGSARRLPAA
jgi:hypothetical protein